jgi:hypothetical protein
MARFFPRTVVLGFATVAVAVLHGTGGQGQSTGGGQGKAPSSSSPSAPDKAGRTLATPPLPAGPIGPKITTSIYLTDPSTEGIVDALGDAVAFCENLPRKDYTIDCLAYQYRQIARRLPASGDYAAVRAVIERAAGRLEGVVADYPSTTLPPARVSRAGVGRTARPLRPVDSARRKEAAAKAIAIVEETRTVLLRSAENSAQRQLHYQRISAAVGSGTVLLRSL